MKLSNFLSLFFIFFLLSCGANTGTPQVNEGVTFVSLTFDDGNADNYFVRNALEAHSMHATFYVITGFVGMPGYMTWDELSMLSLDGNDIGGHTVHHVGLTEIDIDIQRREICQSREDLYSRGFLPVSFAYPYGKKNSDTELLVANCGYNSGRSIKDGPDTFPPGNPYSLKAMPYIVDDSSLGKMKRYVKETISTGGGWAIFTFHHVCDDCDYYSVSLEKFSLFLDWLQNKADDGVIVKSISEVIGEDFQP